MEGWASQKKHSVYDINESQINQTSDSIYTEY